MRYYQECITREEEGDRVLDTTSLHVAVMLQKHCVNIFYPQTKFR